ncbi:hypothetical protein N8Z54_02425 [Octadecabacter sp.]|nr:hypothetical protein [Octadecabacter sp.]
MRRANLRCTVPPNPVLREGLREHTAVFGGPTPPDVHGQVMAHRPNPFGQSPASPLPACRGEKRECRG